MITIAEMMKNQFSAGTCTLHSTPEYSIILQHSTLQRPRSKPKGITKKRAPQLPQLRKIHPKILGPVDIGTSPLCQYPRLHLLGLPSEIRLMIWEFALTSPTQELHYDHNEDRFNLSCIGAGLITTCHSIALETTYLPLRLNTMVFSLIHCYECNPTVCLDYLAFQRKISALEGKLESSLKMKGMILRLPPDESEMDRRGVEEDRAGECTNT